MNSYFGSTLTDAQNAVNSANQLSANEDMARRNFIAMMQEAAARKRQADESAAFNRDQLALRARGMDMDNQNAQMAQLLQALGVVNQFQTGDFNRDFQNKKLEQDASLTRDQLENSLKIAGLTANREDARVAAERLRQQGAASELNANINAEAEDYNSRASAKATQYNALIGMIDQAAKTKAGNTGMPWNRVPDTKAYEKIFNDGLQNIIGQMQTDKGAEAISFDPINKRFIPLLKRVQQQGQAQPPSRIPYQDFNIPTSGGFSSASQPQQPSISDLIKSISGQSSTNQVVSKPKVDNADIHTKVANLANSYMKAGLPRQQAIAKAMNSLQVQITPRAEYPFPRSDTVKAYMDAGLPRWEAIDRAMRDSQNSAPTD